MAVDVTINQIQAGYSISKLNENFNNIQEALQDSVSRSGVEPNQMNVDFDMNGNDILNVGTIQAQDITIDGDSVEGVVARAEAQADRAEAEADRAATEADDAANSAAIAATRDLITFDTVADLLADTSLTYENVEVGRSNVEAQGFRYEVSSSDTTDVYIENGNGVKFHPLPNGSGEIHITQLGAVAGGDAGVNHTAILAAVEATPINGTLVFPGESGKFDVDDQIIINKSISVDMRTTARYTGSVVQPFMVVGDASDSTVLRKQKFRFKVERASYTDWSSFNDIGIRVYNAFSVEELIFDQVQGFKIGAQCRASNGQGFSHTKVYANDFVQNHHHLDFIQETGGYYNENIIFGGRFTNFGTLPDDADPSDRRAIAFRSADDTYPNNNNNLFIKPCFQTAGGIGFLCLSGVMNKIIGARSEGPAVAARFEGSSSANEVEILYASPSSETVIDGSDNATNVVTFARYKDRLQSKVPVFLAPDLRSRWVPYNSEASYVQGLSIGTFSGVGAISFAAGGSSTIVGFSTRLELTGFGVGRKIDTRRAKRFFLDIDAETDSDHRVFIRAYDAAGNLISAANASEIAQYLKGGGRAGERFELITAGFWRTSSPTDRVTFRVSNDVASIWVGVGQTSSGTAKLRGINIFALGDVVSPNSERGDGEFDYPYLVATQQPNRGAHARGLAVFRHNPTSGTAMGWVCTASGSPGTWSTMASLS